MTSRDQTPHINIDYFEDLTGRISDPTEQKEMEIGERIRMIREEKGLSLEALSNLTGFDVATLDRIEKKEFNPQLGTLLRLSKALESAFGRLVSEVGNKLYAVTRKKDQKHVMRSSSTNSRKKLYAYKSLAPEVQGRHMEAFIVQLEVNPEKEMSVHNGEEFIYVLSGNAVVHIKEEEIVLAPGDSIYYLSTTPHMIAAMEGHATILAVIYGG